MTCTTSIYGASSSLFFSDFLEISSAAGETRNAWFTDRLPMVRACQHQVAIWSLRLGFDELEAQL